MKSSIHRRLTLAFIGLAIIPLLLVAIVLAWQSFNVQQQQALLLQREVAQGVGGQVRAFVQKIESQLRLTVELEPLLRLDEEQQSTLLSQLLSYLDVAEELVLLDTGGQEQARLSRLGIVTRADLGSREKAQEFLIPLTSRQSYYSPVRFNQTTGEPFMTLAIPLIEVREGKIEGVLVADIRLKQIWELIASIPVESGDNLYMIDSQGRVVAHRNPSVVLRGTTFERPEQDGRARGLTGELALLASDEVLFGEQSLTIVVERSLWNAFASLINTLLVIGIVLLVAFLIATSFGVLTVRQIVTPIQSLAATAQAIEAGELERQAEVSSQDEIGILAQAFNAMAARQRETIATLEQQVIEIKNAEQTIRESEERFRHTFNDAPIGMLLLADGGQFTQANKAISEMLGWSEEELVTLTFHDITYPDDATIGLAQLQRLRQGEIDSFQVEKRYLHKKGHPVWALMSVATIGNPKPQQPSSYSIVHLQNISQRKVAQKALQEAYDDLEKRIAARTAELQQANHLLQEEISKRKEAQTQILTSLREKEVLLKEIHHRVKNNLQIISSLLYLQSQNIEEPSLLTIFQESEHRIKSMALIHEQLYQSEKLAHIDFADYVTRLTNHLSRSYNSGHISLLLNIENLFLTVETAIPCGLIINELLTNAFKYAFPNRQTGQIEVRMEADEQNKLTLTVKDNGIGFPKEIKPRRPKSLGLTLVTTLTKQLRGTIDVRSQGGTEFELTFSDVSAKKEES